MKKFLIGVIILLIIAGAFFTYKYFIKKDIYFESTQIVLDNTGIFLLYIDDISQENNKNKVTGVITSGTLKKGDEISIVGLGNKGIDSEVLKIEVNNKETETAVAGDYVIITIDSNSPQDSIKKGEAVILSQSTKPIYNISAKVISYNGDLSNLIEKGNIFCINADIACKVELISKEELTIKILLDKPIVVVNKLEFIIKNDNTKLAKCVVLDN